MEQSAILLENNDRKNKPFHYIILIYKAISKNYFDKREYFDDTIRYI